MRRDEGGEPRRADDGDQRLEDVRRGVRIEIAGRLVGEEEARRVGNRAGDGDPLLLAARQFGRPMREPLAEAEEGEELRRRAPAPRSSRGRAMSCGITTFSSAENSGRRWWNW